MHICVSKGLTWNYWIFYIKMKTNEQIMDKQNGTSHKLLYGNNGTETIRTNENDENEIKIEKAEDIGITKKLKLMKNLFVISISFLLTYAAFNAIQNLASSIFNDKGLGVISLSCNYTFAVLVSFITPVFLRKLTPKTCLILSFSVILLFVGLTLHPRYYTLIPASILLGTIQGPLWAAAHIYVMSTSFTYAEITESSAPAVGSFFNGIFFSFMQSSQLLGNLISSLVLQNEESRKTTTKIEGQTCGASFCPYTYSVVNETYLDNLNYSNITNIEQNDSKSVYVLSGTFMAFIVAAIFVVLFGLDKYKEKSRLEKVYGSNLSVAEYRISLPRLLSSTCKLLRNPNLFLMMPLSYVSALSQAMIFSEFNQAFTSCEISISTVGYTMIGFGVCDTLFSLISGRLFHLLGRPVLFGLAYSLNMIQYFIMLTWKPSSDYLWLFFLIPSFSGICDAIYQPQIVAFLGLLFEKNQESAFSNHRVFHNLGYALTFAYSTYLCLSYKIYIAVAITSIAILCYGITEIKFRRKIKDKKINV